MFSIIFVPPVNVFCQIIIPMNIIKEKYLSHCNPSEKGLALLHFAISRFSCLWYIVFFIISASGVTGMLPLQKLFSGDIAARKSLCAKSTTASVPGYDHRIISSGQTKKQRADGL